MLPLLTRHSRGGGPQSVPHMGLGGQDRQQWQQVTSPSHVMRGVGKADVDIVACVRGHINYLFDPFSILLPPHSLCPARASNICNSAPHGPVQGVQGSHDGRCIPRPPSRPRPSMRPTHGNGRCTHPTHGGVLSLREGNGSLEAPSWITGIAPRDVSVATGPRTFATQLRTQPGAAQYE